MRTEVSGHSMEPAYTGGDRLFVSRLYYRLLQPKINDVVLVEHPHNGFRLIKRIKKITPHGYFVMGDNVLHSQDSRQFGALKKEQIIGKVLFRYSISSLPRPPKL